MGHRHRGRRVRRVSGGSIRRRPAHRVRRRHRRRLPRDRVRRQVGARRVLVPVLREWPGGGADAAARLRAGTQRHLPGPLRQPGADGVARPATRHTAAPDRRRPVHRAQRRRHGGVGHDPRSPPHPRARQARRRLPRDHRGVLARGRDRDPARPVRRPDAAGRDARDRSGGPQPCPWLRASCWRRCCSNRS